MKDKYILIILVLFSLLTLSCFMVPMARSSPKTPDLEIHIYPNSETGNYGMDDGTLDIISWPLSEKWIGKWAVQPEKVTLKDYVEMGMTQFDIDNQRWPCGVIDMNVTQADIAADPDYNASRDFRRAIAYLTDRDMYIRDILKGYGYRLDVPKALWESDCVDMPAYEAEGLIYHYNKTKAEETLDAGGFIYGSDSIRNDPRKAGDQNLEDIIFIVQKNAPDRKEAAKMLVNEMRGVGIPVDFRELPRIICYKNIMIEREFHLYTGSWTFTATIDQYYDLYSSYTYYGPDESGSPNYVGFCNQEFSELAKEVKYPATVQDAKIAAIECGRVFLEFCPVIPLWSLHAFKAYKTGWNGVVCGNGGYGIDNRWTFLNMYKTDDSKIDWGLTGNIGKLNVIVSGVIPPRDAPTLDFMLEASKVLDLIYDSMLGYNPFNLALTEGWLAESWKVGS